MVARGTLCQAHPRFLAPFPPSSFVMTEERNLFFFFHFFKQNVHKSQQTEINQSASKRTYVC